MTVEFLQPQGWARPKGYSNGTAATGRQVFIAGQIGWDATGRFNGSALADQVRQALANIVLVLAQARGRPQHITRMTWYVTDLEEYRVQLQQIGAAYRSVMGKHFPAMTVVQVVALLEREAKVEIEATAVIPDVG